MYFSIYFTSSFRLVKIFRCYLDLHRVDKIMLSFTNNLRKHPKLTKYALPSRQLIWEHKLFWTYHLVSLRLNISSFLRPLNFLNDFNIRIWVVIPHFRCWNLRFYLKIDVNSLLNNIKHYLSTDNTAKTVKSHEASYFILWDLT